MSLAGCAHRPGPIPGPVDPDAVCGSYDEPTFVDGPAFSGANAFGHVVNLTCDFEGGSPTFSDRVPGTQGHERARAYLEAALAREGWQPWIETFSGEAFERMEHGAVESYLHPPRCTDDRLDRMRGLEFHNVLAERGDGPDLLYLMAHYDAKREASQDRDPANRTLAVPAANDGASGVGVLLELSRLVPTPANLTIRIFLTDGEDGFEDCHPLAGAIAHVQNLGDEDRARVVGVVLLDMVGDAQARFCLAGNDGDLRETFQAAAQAEGVASISQAPTCTVHDDITPFVEAGMPSLDLIDFDRPRTGFPPYWHTRQDTPDKLSPAMLGDVGRVLLGLVATLEAA